MSEIAHRAGARLSPGRAVVWARVRGKGREHVVGKDGTSSIPDEEGERFLREAEAGTRGAPQEPSARARIVARRLKEQPGQPEGWRTHQPARRRRGKAWYAVGLLAAVGLLLVALDPGRVTGWFGGGDEPSAPLAAESERPDQPPATEAAARLPTLDEPFRGSPAARWGDGTAGIHLPAARATGWMTEEQVARTLDKSRDFLVASSLDAGVLRGERPKRAIALINPHQRDVRDYLATAFRTPSRDNDPLLLFSRFAKDVRLVGDVVKTRGRITFREGERGAVEVTTDVTYVYPVVRAKAGSDEVARTSVRREVVMSWDDPEKVVVAPGTFSPVSYKVDIASGGCGTYTGYSPPGVRRRTRGHRIGGRARGRPVRPRHRHGHADGAGRRSGVRDRHTVVSDGAAVPHPDRTNGRVRRRRHG